MKYDSNDKAHIIVGYDLNIADHDQAHERDLYHRIYYYTNAGGTNFSKREHWSDIDPYYLPTGYDVSIALDSSNQPTLLFVDDDDKDRMRADYKSGGNWYVNSLNPDYSGRAMSVTQDNTFSVFVSHMNRMSPYNLHYSKRNGSWNDGQSAGNSGVLDRATGIALDSSSHPHIAYFAASSGDVMYTYYNGNSWSIAEVADDYPTGTSNLMEIALAIDSSGKAHIVYTTTNSSGFVRYAYMP